MPLTRQLSLFGVEATAPGAEDLDGLLAGPGQVVRMGGTARVSVVVDDMWRAAALTVEMRVRGFAATCVATVDERLGLRTRRSTAAVVDDRRRSARQSGRGATARPLRGRRPGHHAASTRLDRAARRDPDRKCALGPGVARVGPAAADAAGGDRRRPAIIGTVRHLAMI